MRFPQAWAEVAKQNNVLRIAIIGVTLASALALLISLKFAFKDPLIIERGCYSSQIAATSSQDPTKEEIEGFLRESISQRFDTDANVQADLISLDEIASRSAEQEQLKRRGIRQRVLVNSITTKDDSYQLDTDRLLSVGQLRSALSFPLTVKIQRASRSVSNPFGLVVVKVSAQNAKGGNENEGK
jgi:hypothetical protein